MQARALFVSAILFLPTSVLAEEGRSKGSFLQPDVDNPPAEVYEPLHGIGHQQGISSRVNGSDEIEQSRELRQEARQASQARENSPAYRRHVQEITQTVPIADGTSAPVKANPVPAVRRRQDGSLFLNEE